MQSNSINHPSRLWFHLGLCLGFLGSACAEPAAFRDAPSHEELSLKLRKMEQEDPMKKFEAATGEDPSLNLPTDLFDKSEIICFGGLMTLVPKRAIIHVPKDLESRLRPEDGARIVGWLEFLAANRNWVSTQEVTRAQAEGKEPFPEETAKSLASSRGLVVAVYQGGPISVLAPASPAAAEDAAGR